jgi:2,4-dienoyl-CoA reductase-like NADH-dependent reductase (Old Yellow Enzyme family)
VREAWPKERALGARITASDWAPGGFEAQEAVAYARALKAIGFDYVCVSSGGAVAHQRIKVVPGYQVGFAESVKRGAQLPVMAVGMIAEPQQAEDILAERFGVKLDYPPQYRRAHPEQWPGAVLARPRQTA